MADHFGDFLKNTSEAKWRYLGVVYRYGFSTRITLIWNLIPRLALGMALGISLRIPSSSWLVHYYANSVNDGG